ncbi:MAG TPA: hypothetical protein DEA96_14610 [Leptospiraceae bacterium]|nr:hypothetical protein [Spirochaetaceae bacterium]HBS06197.1 hypothetical protein [Leptospiraceae bacterium]
MSDRSMRQKIFRINEWTPTLPGKAFPRELPDPFMIQKNLRDRIEGSLQKNFFRREDFRILG